MPIDTFQRIFESITIGTRKQIINNAVRSNVEATELTEMNGFISLRFIT